MTDRPDKTRTRRKRTRCNGYMAPIAGASWKLAYLFMAWLLFGACQLPLFQEKRTRYP